MNRYIIATIVLYEHITKDKTWLRIRRLVTLRVLQLNNVIVCSNENTKSIKGTSATRSIKFIV